ncbi:MAG: hypothetical protein QE267_08595 [Akkermansiaceae bacterium]|nr:hypothetical protein [Akkermansiaceae bacterium]
MMAETDCIIQGSAGFSGQLIATKKAIVAWSRLIDPALPRH